MTYKSIEEIKRQMERYCAYQERSHYQVEKKLRELNTAPEAIDHIVVHLIQENFLNEERFAKAYVRGKFYQKKWGKIKIIQGLRQHRIHQKLIDKSLLEISEDDYYQTLTELIKKKCKQLSGTSKQKKSKLIRYLYQKGYNFSDYTDLLNNIC
jgi:regulatory protein